MTDPKNGTDKAATPATVKQETQLQLIKRSVVDVVAGKVEQFLRNGELLLPKNYSPDNAMKAAWLILQGTGDREGKPVLEVCTRDSIANALLDMVVQGLNPLKKQNYFIAYGRSLSCQRSYFGSMAVAKMVQPKIDDFAFAVVYEGDKFTYGIQNGKKAVTLHEQDIKNVDKAKIMAAYCIALDKEGNPFRTEIMTFDEIKQSWKQSKMNPVDANGNIKADSTHGKFTADMALKTVINKTCKAIINASSDNALLLDRINRNDKLADRASVEADISDKANLGDVVDITEGQEAGQPLETAGKPWAIDGMEEQTGQPGKEAEPAVQRSPGF